MSFNDMAITAKIKSNFASDDSLNAADINIDTHNGVVTLKGNVPNSTSKNHAEDVAKQTNGVKEVHNELNVGNP